MMTGPTISRPAISLIHGLPAGVKVLTLLAASAGVHWINTPMRVVIASLAVAACFAIARIPAAVAITYARALLPVLAALAGFQALVSGWQNAVVVVGALVVLVALAALVSLTTTTTAMVDTVVRVVRPLRRCGVDPERLGLIIALGIRSVTVVTLLAAEVREAQLARGLSPTPRTIAVPLLIRALRHAHALGDALAARGLDD